MDRTPGELIGDIVALHAMLTVVVFTVVYGGFFRWTKYPAGRALFSFFVSLSAVLFLSVISTWMGTDFRESGGREILRIFIYSLPLLSGYWLLFELARSWFRGEPGLPEPRFPEKGQTDSTTGSKSD